MSEVKDCVSIDAIKEFLERDCQRILKSFLHDEHANGEEVVLFTERMCLQVSFESLKRNYPKVMEFFKQKNDLSNLICKKVELLMGDGIGAIYGNSFEFKLTFVKVNI